MSGSADIALIDVDIAHEDDPATVLVHDVNWRIGPGEWWVVCGAPASGKSSLLATAAGLSPPVGGSLRIFGRDLRAASEREQVEWRRRIGFVFDGGGRLFGHLSVLENLLLPLQYHGDLDPSDALARAQELLALTGLQAYAGLRPSRLGTALQQRVSLLRALSVPVRVLFIDNPLAGLAPSAVRWWLEFLDGLRARQAARDEPLSLVAGSYEFSDWLGRADHFAVIEDRRFRTLDDPEAATAYREDGALPQQPGVSS